MTRHHWSTVEARLRMHARDAGFKRRVAGAMRRIRDIDDEGLPLFLALSGGKDSVALAGMLVECDVYPHAVHVHTELNTPGTLDVVDATIAMLGLSLDVWEPEHDVWELLRIEPADKRDELFDKASSGSLLVSYTYAHHEQWAGSWTGMRAEESRGRMLNARARGALYQLKIDGKWIAQPLLWLSPQDVLAYALDRGLPIHPHYRRAYERFGATPERSRVDCLVTPPGVAALGAHAEARVLYPDLWARIEEARPSLRGTR